MSSAALKLESPPFCGRGRAPVRVGESIERGGLIGAVGGASRLTWAGSEPSISSPLAREVRVSSAAQTYAAARREAAKSLELPALAW